MKLGTQLKDDIKKEFLEKNPPSLQRLVTNIELNTIAPQLVFILSGSKMPKCVKMKTTTNVICVPAFYSRFLVPLAPIDKITSEKQRFFFKP